MASTEEAAQLLTDAIVEMTPKISGARGLLELAEALAWLRSPDHPHGASAPIVK